MPTSPVDIANQCLSAIGTQSAIADFNEDSTEAIHVRIWYEPTRTDLLRKYRFGFARRQRTLALFAAAQGTPENPSGNQPLPDVPWLYAYLYPDSTQAIWRILPLVPVQQNAGIPLTTAPTGVPMMRQGPAVPFAIGIVVDAKGNQTQVILTNQPQAIAIVAHDVTNPDMFDSLFQSAFVGRLAAALVGPLSGDKKLAEIAINNGLRAEQDAAAADGKEGWHTTNKEADWIRARGYATDFMSDPSGGMAPMGAVDPYGFNFDG